MLIVFGSINVDMLFRVAALPRPGETVLCPEHALAPGGKGANQATAAARAGAAVRMVGAIGPDAFGALALGALEAAGVDGGGLLRVDRPTGVAVIGVDDRGENQIIVASGANLEVRAALIADEDLSPATTLLCQNEVPPAATFALIGRAAARGARTILNLAPAGEVPAGVLDALDVLVVNRLEAETAAGPGAPEEPVDLAGALARRHQLTCVVTLGASGAVALGPKGGYRVPALEVAARDTTGAGDAFVGVLAAALDRGWPLADALCRASVAAGLACEQIGAQTSQPDAAAIEARLGELPEPLPLA